MVKLLVFDMDGTALGGHTPYDEFPRPFSRFLDSLDAMSIRWATNTTWGTEEQWALIRRSGVKSTPAFLAGQTGRQLATVKRGRLIHDEALAGRMRARDRRFRRKNRRAVNEVMTGLLRSDLVVRLAFSFFGHNTLAFTCRRNKRAAAWRVAEPLLESGEFYAWDPFTRGDSATFVPFYFNKGEVVGIMQKRLGIGPENTVVAGDGTNDLHMFDPKFAGWVVCPANAPEPVKAFVRSRGGIAATKSYSRGVVEGFRKILKRAGGRGRP